MPDLSALFVVGPRNVTVNPLLGAQLLLPFVGVMSGPGNQGSSSNVMLQGQAGTPATQTGLPRQARVGASSFTGTV